MNQAMDQGHAGRALITGASSGIGRECAYELAARGFNLVLVARREDRLQELWQAITAERAVHVTTLILDLTHVDAVDQVYETVRAMPGDIDILINNAGFGIYGAFAATDWEREAAMIGLHVMALTRLTKLILRDMLTRGSGRILNVSSTAALRPGPLCAVYAASKAYVLAFSQAIGAEVAGTGVSVTTLCPGPTATEFLDVAGADAKRILLHRRPASAKSVAHFGVEALLAGRSVAIPGMVNRCLAVMSRFMSARVLAALALRLRQGKTPS
jgi:short-subunit dehydrogenase